MGSSFCCHGCVESHQQLWLNDEMNRVKLSSTAFKLLLLQTLDFMWVRTTCRHTQSHSRRKPYTFHISALQQKQSLLRSSWLRLKRKKSTDGDAANRRRQRFRFWDSSPAIGRSDPSRHPPARSDWSVFPALWKSFEYASLCGSLQRCWFKLTQISRRATHNGAEHSTDTLLKDRSVCYTPSISILVWDQIQRAEITSSLDSLFPFSPSFSTVPVSETLQSGAELHHSRGKLLMLRMVLLTNRNSNFIFFLLLKFSGKIAFIYLFFGAKYV